ncbi:fimbrial protein [Acinetobacter bereziniae]|nr:fimbrial protein [Acinetobacter bereziniae]MCU4313822.1 fimbrial protein [Acinetobacter bereziniae]
MNIMKKCLYHTFFLLMINFSLQSYAHAVLGTYNFTLKGNVVLFTCGVDQGAAIQAIKMGTISIRSLKKPGDKSPRMPIPFNLMQCPANAQITFSFIGEQNSVDKELLALSNANATTTAKHVAIEITDSNRNRVPISISGGTTNKSPVFLADANGNLSVIFYANYVATDGAVTAGVANANAEFKIEYQ